MDQHAGWWNRESCWGGRDGEAPTVTGKLKDRKNGERRTENSTTLMPAAGRCRVNDQRHDELEF